MTERLALIEYLLNELKRRRRKCRRLRRNLKIIAKVYGVKIDMEELKVKHNI